MTKIGASFEISEYSNKLVQFALTQNSDLLEHFFPIAKQLKIIPKDIDLENILRWALHNDFEYPLPDQRYNDPNQKATISFPD